MFRSFGHYIVALITLLGASTVYQLVMTPLLRPPKIAAVPLKPERALVTEDTLSDLFADDQWQRGVCKRLQTATGMLLFQNWEQTTDDHWRLWPITIIIGRGMSEQSGRNPVILQAEAGAEIRFAESLDPFSSEAPPIQNGRLKGIVEISRPNEDPSKSLLIRTANVGIDNRKLWTTDAIQMRFGNARLVGRDLTLHLATAAGTPVSGSSPAAVLDRMELIYLDEFVMPIERQSIWHSDSADSGPNAATANVSLHCGGRVEYDFALDKLSLRSQVAFVHQMADGTEDRFDCDVLELMLRDPTNRDITRIGPLDWVNRVTALGSPAKVQLPSFDCRVAAERIDFKAVDGLLVADGRTGVEIHRGGIGARLTQLAYQFNPNDPQAIGAFDAFGAGIVTIKEDRIPIRTLRWKEGLSAKPRGPARADDLSNPGTDSEINLWIDGEVQAQFTDGGTFQASAVEGVLKPTANGGIGGRTSFAPRWFRATDQVRIDTSAIVAESQLLQLMFVDEPDAKQKPERSTDSGVGSMRQWVAQPGDPKNPVARPRPGVRGDSISAELVIGREGVQARDLTVIGSVELVHSITAGSQTLPVKLTGEQLRWKDGGGEDVLQLGSGTQSPASFDMGDGYFIGPLIQIWPAENLVEINHAGEFRLPTAVLPTGLAGDGTSNIRWTAAPHCRWQGAMRFDGKMAVLTDGVTIKAALVNDREPWDLDLTGDQLEVVLQQAVEVQNVQTIRSAQVQQIAMLPSKDRPVIVQAHRRAADGVLEARHVLHAQRLTLLPLGGKLIGDGPGWYRSWMRSPTKGPLSTISGPSTEAVVDANERSLTGVHLMYHQSLEGNLATRSLAFLRGVRVGIRPVQTWDETFDVAQMQSISMGESTLDCDQLRVSVTPGYEGPSRRIAGMPVPWEMEAIRGVVFRTRSDRGLLEGTASRAVYASIKDLFTVEGAPGQASIIRQTQPNGQPGPELSIREMTIRPRTMEIENLQLERLNLGNLPTTPKR